MSSRRRLLVLSLSLSLWIGLAAGRASAQSLSAVRSITLARGAAQLRNALALTGPGGLAILEQSSVMTDPDVAAFLASNPSGIQSALTFDTRAIWEHAGQDVVFPPTATTRLVSGCSAGIGRDAVAMICSSLLDAGRTLPGFPGVLEHASAIPAPVPPDVQRHTLDLVLERVRRVSRATGRPAVVEVDLDFTGMQPLQRTYDALRQVGERFDIPELRTPERLPILPPYHPLGFRQFLEQTGLVRLDEPWDNVMDVYAELTWSGDWASDVVTPGLAQFVSRVEADGGVVVFNTARDDVLRGETERAFRRGGIEHPILLMRPDPDIPGAEHKARAHALIRELLGEPVALFDDVGENLTSLGEIDPAILTVRVGLPAFTSELPPAQMSAASLAISTFEMP